MEELYVAEHERHAGVGTRLMERLLEAAKRSGVERSTVFSATKDVERVVRFYARFGYHAWSAQLFKGATGGSAGASSDLSAQGRRGTGAPDVLTAPEQATPAWLTEALRTAGVLGRGRVTHVRRTGAESASTWALHHLEVRYSAGASAAPAISGAPALPPGPGELPARLLLKISHNAPLAPGVAPHHGLSTGKEVWFYHHLATEAAMAPVPLVRCYAAAHDPPYGASHALVDDLSATHAQPPLLLPPSRAHCVQAIDGLARLHAAWWQHPRLAPGGDIPERLAWERAAASAIGRLDPMDRVVPAFLDYLDDRLSPDQHRVYERLLVAEPWLRERQEQRPQTLLHGDAHWWNFLYPNEAGTDTTRLLDWGSWRTGVGTSDLAYMMALHGYRAWRTRFERDLLHRYHQTLVRAGVGGYEWPACWDDYRWSVASSLLVAPRFWSIDVPASIWWPKLECGLAAFEDLGCAQLLDG